MNAPFGHKRILRWAVGNNSKMGNIAKYDPTVVFNGEF